MAILEDQNVAPIRKLASSPAKFQPLYSTDILISNSFFAGTKSFLPFSFPSQPDAASVQVFSFTSSWANSSSCPLFTHTCTSSQLLSSHFLVEYPK